MCEHHWVKNGTKNGRQRYRCQKCGMTKIEGEGKVGRPKTNPEIEPKTYTYTFERYRSYSSHSGLSDEMAKSIHDGNYNNFPQYVVYDEKKYWIEPIDWSCEPIKIMPSGYLYFADGLRWRVENISKSPDYDKPSGNGWSHDRITIKSDRPLEIVPRQD